MNNSVVRYSRQVTTSPGIARLADGTRQFQYGNADVSGDLEHDGLTMAWISSPLRISPPEQRSFLGRLAKRQLGVSQNAYDMAVKPSYGQRSIPILSAYSSVPWSLPGIMASCKTAITVISCRWCTARKHSLLNSRSPLLNRWRRTFSPIAGSALSGQSASPFSRCHVGAA
ncbi:hypothetical protein PO883_07295 [Massilia sp. DJPM01]|nr:hypothetical protein [Massilia sp. DJPM01]MDM5177002.1 hypothetical protein [Massilia sp. DJPM01]